ncbi:hypothetical protein K502DRAFT_350075 [Neoconidiobolus thromboides FSU 785]|nr:hypothetical protein K502DRAFT_350075 [Neoconidiobolus thromboides FSU 785]
MNLFKNNPWKKSYNQYIFILVSITQAIIVIALEGVLYGMIVNNSSIQEQKNPVGARSTADFNKADGTVRSVQIYMILFMLSQVFQVIFIIESVYFKNILQIFAILVFNLMTMIYAIFQYTQVQSIIIQDKIRLIVGLLAGFIALGQLLLFFFGYKLYQEFGWYIYKVLGADIGMRRMLIYYYTFLMALKFSIFFAIGFLTQFLVFSLYDSTTELATTVAAFPIALVIIYLGVIGVQRENKYLLGFTLGGFVLVMAYFAYKIVRFWTRDLYNEYKYFLTWFAVLALLDIVGSFIFGTLCFRNFDKGLKNYIHDKGLKPTETKEEGVIDLADD